MTQPPVSLDEEIRALQGAICLMISEWWKIADFQGLISQIGGLKDDY